MSTLKPITVNVDAYLGLNKYEVDEGNPHIEVAPEPETELFKELVRICPAGLYKMDGDQPMSVDFAGCLECGTCRIVGAGAIIASWRYPSATMGIEYRYG
ncbi:MAG: 4Fe-4S dicluster domain-containing protein [Propionibacteriaceae bacterium]|jgi:ferredoxin-like protein FixX|nr:4Fe-4S dicluster domain-containing protein [Propionibacteriaceae bacterium]